MTLTIQLPPDAEARLAENARSAGMDVPTYAGQILELESRRPVVDQGSTGSPLSKWPPGYIEQTYGSLAEDPLEIPADPIPPAMDSE